MKRESQKCIAADGNRSEMQSLYFVDSIPPAFRLLFKNKPAKTRKWTRSLTWSTYDDVCHIQPSDFLIYSWVYIVFIIVWFFLSGYWLLISGCRYHWTKAHNQCDDFFLLSQQYCYSSVRFFLVLFLWISENVDQFFVSVKNQKKNEIRRPLLNITFVYFAALWISEFVCMMVYVFWFVCFVWFSFYEFIPFEVQEPNVAHIYNNSNADFI